MAEIHSIGEAVPGKLHGRGRRSLNLSTKLTAEEAKAIEEAATRDGKTPSEWARGILLGNGVPHALDDMQSHIFTELVGIQLLLMDTLEPLLRGDKIAPDQLAALFRRSQSAKAVKAQEILERRREKKEK
jgi:hypothetical protein